MKRIGGLKQQVGAGVQRAHRRRPHAAAADRRVLRRDPRARGRAARAARASCSTLLERARHPRARRTSRSTADEQRALREHYFKNIFPLVTPQAMDPAHPFPFISNLSLNLLVTRALPEATPSSCWRASRCRSARGIPRFLRVGDATHASCRSRTSWRTTSTCSSPAWRSTPASCFRVTRNANTERDEEEADDLLAHDRVGAARPPLRADRAPRGERGHGARSTAACSPPSSASTSAPTSSRSTACWRCAT